MIVDKGDMASSYYIIKKGIVDCMDCDVFIRSLE